MARAYHKYDVTASSERLFSRDGWASGAGKFPSVYNGVWDNVRLSAEISVLRSLLILIPLKEALACSEIGRAHV